MIANKKFISKEILIFLLFILLTALMTYPLLFNLHKAKDLGDPLFISWNIAWNIHKLLSDPLNLFHANIFYPNRNTLAYSEHLLGLSLFAIPVYLTSKNPIFTYNILAFFTFVLSGYGTYLFSFHLTKNRFASIVAGIIFAFYPYKIYQFGHLHVISTHWIPFAFLFLFRFFEKRDYNNLGLLLLFSFLQILSSGSLAIFFVISMSITGIFLLIHVKGYRDRGLILKLSIASFVSFIVFLPFYIPYLENQKTMGFIRETYEIGYYSARIENYLSSTSRLYYPLTASFGKPERHLFPGIIPIVLAISGFMGFNRTKNSYPSKLVIAIDTGTIICFFFIIITLLFGGIDIKLFGLRMRSKNLLFPWLILASLILIKIPLNKTGQPFLLSSIFSVDKRQACFLLIALFGVSSSLGIGGSASDNLYNFLYAYIPGFKFVRVPARIAMFVSFFLSLLAAYGIKRLMGQIYIRKAIFVLAPLILIEYASFPIEFQPIGEMPKVYKEIEKQKGDFAIIEIPIDNFMLNAKYLYYSTSHWKKLVNGYSGFFPPSDYFLQVFSLQGLPWLLDYLNYIGVKYMVVHRDNISDEYNGLIKGLKDRLILKKTFEYDDVYEIIDSKEGKKKPSDLSSFKELTHELWNAFSDNNTSDLKFSFDGNLETRWHSGKPQDSETFFILDLGNLHSIRALSIELGRFYKDYPRGLILEVSKDSKNWENISIKNNVFFDLLCSSINSPRNISYVMLFEPVQSRYIRMKLAGSDDTYYWSIPEIRVFTEG